MRLDPIIVKKNFLLIQMIFGGLSLAILWMLLNRKKGDTQFKIREAELPKKQKLTPSKNKAPNLLAGISIHGRPHEIMSLSENATESEINKRYRTLMKQYHPDVISRPGTPQWSEAQKIAEAINRARDQMLEKLKNKA